MGEVVLAEKGEFKLVWENGCMKIKGSTALADMEFSLKGPAVIDAIGLAIPGDQKQLAVMLKAALGIV